MSEQKSYVKSDVFNGLFIPFYVVENKNLTDGAKLLYGWFGEFTTEQPYIEAYLEELAEKTNVGTRQVKRLIDELKRAGLIHVVQTGRANRYYLAWNEDMKIDPEEFCAIPEQEGSHDGA